MPYRVLLNQGHCNSVGKERNIYTLNILDGKLFLIRIRNISCKGCFAEVFRLWDLHILHTSKIIVVL